MRSTGAQSTVGRLSFGNLQFRCALGRGGIRSRKREGDGATPRGTFKLEGAYWRSDALRRPQTALPLRKTRPDDGWCDAANDRNYNCAVKHPYPASAERLWRQDRLYDVVVVIDRPLQLAVNVIAPMQVVEDRAPLGRVDAAHHDAALAGCDALPESRRRRRIQRARNDIDLVLERNGRGGRRRGMRVAGSDMPLVVTRRARQEIDQGPDDYAML